jgi:hypothetical protein
MNWLDEIKDHLVYHEKGCILNAGEQPYPSSDCDCYYGDRLRDFERVSTALRLLVEVGRRVNPALICLMDHGFEEGEDPRIMELVEAIAAALANPDVAALLEVDDER